MNTFPAFTAVDYRSSKLLAARPATVVDMATGQVVETFTLFDQPSPVVTNTRGWAAPFRADADMVEARISGGDPIPLVALELQAQAAELDQVINGGRLSEASLKDTIATEAVEPARAAAIDVLAEQPEVADAAALRANTIAADPAIAGVLDTTGSATRKRLPDAANTRGYGTDQQAILDALTDAAARQVPAFSPGGTVPFPASSSGNIIGVPAGQTLQWQGTGTLLKVPDGTVTGNYQRVLQLASTGTGQGEAFGMSGVTIDGNRRANTPPDTYGWEHNAALLVSNIRHVTLRDLTFIDPIADCVSVNDWGNETLLVDGMRVLSRTGTRSDITFSALPRDVRVSNFIGQRIEAELVGNLPAGAVTPIAQFTNVTCRQSFDWAVPGIDSVIQVTNSWLKDVTLVNARGTITDTTLFFGVDAFNGRRIRWPRGLTFDNCDIYLESDANGAIAPIYIDDATATDVRLAFQRCRFHVAPHPDYTGTTFTGQALRAAISTGDGTVYDVEVSDCWFDPRFATSVLSDRAQSVRLTNNTWAGRTHAVHLSISNPFNYRHDITVTGGNFDAVTGNPVRIEGGDQAVGSLTLRDIHTRKGGLTHGSTLPAAFTFASTRVITTEAAPTGGGVVGDRARLRVPVAGQPVEWVATVTHPTNAQWKPLAAIGA